MIKINNQKFSLKLIIIIFCYFFVCSSSNSQENKILFKVNNEIITSIDLVNEIGEYGGLWQSSAKVDTEVEKLADEPHQLVKALHCQIKFYLAKGQKNFFRKLPKREHTMKNS